jgi:cell division protein FtsI/penicillin-binding protein 2
LLTIAAVLAGAVWARLAYWQVFRHVQLSASAQAQYRELVPLPAARGAIFDRNMTQLVVNTTVYSAFVSPDQIAAGDRDRVATALSSVLGVDKPALMQTLESGSKFA